MADTGRCEIVRLLPQAQSQGRLRVTPRTGILHANISCLSAVKQREQRRRQSPRICATVIKVTKSDAAIHDPRQDGLGRDGARGSAFGRGTCRPEKHDDRLGESYVVGVILGGDG